MNAPRFDSTVTLGHIITAASMVVAIVGFFFVTDTRLKNIEEKLANYTDVLVTVARQNEQIDQLKERLREVERRVK